MDAFRNILDLIGFTKYIQPGIAVFIITMGFAIYFDWQGFISKK